MKKTWLILLIGFALVAGGATWYLKRDEGGGKLGYKTVEVTRGDVVSTITANGTVEPEELIDVGAQVAGQILAFGKDTDGHPIDYRSKVKEGMVLAQLDDVTYKAELTQAQAQLANARAGIARAQADLQQFQAKLVQAEADWKRAEKLGPSDALAQAAYDQYRAAYESAKANVAVGNASIIQAEAQQDQAQANLERAQRNLAYCTIKSPVDGEVIDRRVNIGQTVVASLNAPSLFLIAKDLRRMQVWTAVNEADIGNIKPGQDVTFTVDAVPNRTFKGSVGKVRLNATMTSNVVTYTVEVVTDNSDMTLLPYLTANVSFQIAKHQGVLTVPNAALRWQPTDPEDIVPESRAEFASAAGGGRGGAGGGGGADHPPAPAPSSQPTTRHSGRGGAIDHPASTGTRQRGVLWVEDGEFVKPIKVRLGVTDGLVTEVYGEGLSEGTKVITGELQPGQANTDEQARNPFAPNFRRGSSGRR
jgi:HlyD family secretion protein